jgi:hypothetical protein
MQTDMYTVHSWVGIASFGMFALQALAGLFTFWTSVFSVDFKRNFVVIHKVIGLGLLASTVELALMNEKNIYCNIDARFK